MKLKLILPVADTPATRRANEGISQALKVLDGGTEVSVSFLPRGFESLDAFYKVGFNSPEIVRAAVEAQKEGVDGIFVNCVADPGVDMARELVRVPVFGAFRPTMMTALGCGKRISIIIPGKEDPAGVILLDRVIESNSEFARSIVLREFTGLDVLELHQKEKLLDRLCEFARLSEHRYGCDCMVLGCTAMSYIVGDLRRELAAKGAGITVLEPLSCGIKMLETFVRLGISNTLSGKVKNQMELIK